MAIKVSAKAFAEFLLERADAKDGYILGATGQDPKALSAWWFNQYSGAQYKSAIYWKNHARRVWDCNGLAEGYYKDVTGASINTRARYNYSGWCSQRGEGMIPKDKRVPGAAVFWGDAAAKITHVAFLAQPVNTPDTQGDWVLVEARSVSLGVVKTKLNARKPKYWGWMDKYFDYGAGAAAPVAGMLICAGEGVNMRKGPGTRFESVGKARKGDLLLPIDAAGWTPVEVNGEALWMSSQYLKEG